MMYAPRLFLLAALFWATTLPPIHAQGDPAADLLAQMTVAEKVGQLFIVAFWGRNPSPTSRAGVLIQQHKIGGVVLITSNSNLANVGADTPAEVLRLSNVLQGMSLDDAGSGIPLFIAIDHEGDGFPYTRITNGVTPLPNPMAIGATWNVDDAAQVGEIVGQELSAMGINVLLGPVVDVLDDPRPGGKGDIGTRAFGGDPYWVGEMGRAYIYGLHQGSEGRMLTVAKHFPGHGGSDRLPDDEVATVDKSLQELRRVELAPFFVLANPQDAQGLDRTDAVMSSHIRYRGLYGDIRQFTRPISFDAESMQAILDLPEFREWREDGLMVSDSLGVPAVRKYFDPQLQTFPHRQIAREALLAGNDLLILSEFALEFDWTQQFDNIVAVLTYFSDTYERDPAFAARVDEAVTRILRFKYRLYPEFTLQGVLTPPERLARVGQGSATVNEIARRAATVLQPTEDSLPPPPRRDEDILIFAEERLIQECYDAEPACQPRPLLPVQAVEQAILNLYGPEGTGQVDPARVHTRIYAQLKSYLTRSSDQDDVGALLEGAEWIVFAMLDPNPRYPDADALQLFLAQNAHQIYDANVVVLAYTAPYYLDATEISKLTAYYVFYSKTGPFIQASARALFGEIRPQGRSPVSIEGTYYDLNTQLAPDPAQRIALSLIAPTERSALVPVTLRLRTNLIRDRNGNPVPDDTQVRFVVQESASRQTVQTQVSLTTGGIAEATLTLDRPGRVIVTASSGDAIQGLPLAFEALPQPTPTPTRAAPTPTPTPSPTPSPTPTPTPQAATLADVLDAWQGRPPDLLGVLGAVALAGVLGYLAWGRKAQAARRVRLALATWAGALLGYLAHGWGWIALDRWLDWPTWLHISLLSLGGALLLATITTLPPEPR
jgi:beta-N-acetylhexosaminidase